MRAPLGWRARTVLLFVSLLVLLPGTFRVSLTDRDEGWYAQVSREMATGGDWLIPHYLGQPWIAKPPLLYWCVAGLFHIFGVSGGVARLVPIAAMTISVQLLATLAARLLNRRAALFAALAFVTAGLPAIVGKLLLTDALLLLWCLAAMVMLWRIATERPTVLRSVAFWLCIGLGILTKGPAIFVFVGGFALGLLTLGHARRWLFSKQLWLTSPTAVLIAAPWYIYVALHAGGTLTQQFLGYEVLSRLTSAPHGHGGPPGYYILLSLAGWLPWTVLVPGAVLEMLRDRRQERVAWVVLLGCCVPWAFLELIPSKLPHYIMPCYALLAVMFGRMWDIGLTRTPTRGQRVALGAWVLVAGLLGAAVAVLGRAWPAAIVAGGLLALGFLVVVGNCIVRGRLHAAWNAAIVVTVAFYVVAGGWLLPSFEPYRLSRNIAEQANAIAPPEAQVFAVGYDEPTMFFYLDRPATVVPANELVSRVNARARPCVVIAHADALPSEVTSAHWIDVRGFNYVKGRDVTVRVGVVTPSPTAGPARAPR